MCIRDSDLAAVIEDDGPAARGALVDGDDVLVRHLFQTSQPVSYTHLRAHETVLDLVCRLLLEKKNTEVPNTPL